MNKENCTTVIWLVWDKLFLAPLLLLSLCSDRRIKLSAFKQYMKQLFGLGVAYVCGHV